MEDNITISKVGPIEQVTIPIPDEGGIVVLRGRNGSGKTTAIEAVETLLSGDGKLSVKDGNKRGTVEGFGVTINVTRSTKVSGELEVTGLQGKFSIGDLIDPGLKTADAADARRIKALLNLSGAEPDVSMFRDKITDFDEIVPREVLAEKDIVVMGQKIKARCDDAALKEEKAADNLEGKAVGLRQGIDPELLKEAVDPKELDARLEKAIQERASAVAKSEAYVKELEKFTAATKALQEAEAGAKHRPVAELNAEIDRAKAKNLELEAKMTELQEELERLLAIVNENNGDIAKYLKEAEHSAAADKMLASYRATVNAGEPIKPDPDAVLEAGKKVDVARAAIERAGLARDAKRRESESKEIMIQVAGHKRRALGFRDSAASINEILSDAVGKLDVGLRVKDGRLVIKTERGPDTLFQELSDGERATIAVDIAIKCVPDASVLTLDQHVFEGLDGNNRKLLADHCRKKNIVLLTAMATDDPNITTEVV